jgi:hypothetical protein
MELEGEIKRLKHEYEKLALEKTCVQNDYTGKFLSLPKFSINP